MKTKATVLKSLRTTKGAEEYLAMFKHRLPEGAVVVKSLDGFDMICDSTGAPMAGVGGGGMINPAHVIIQETLVDGTTALYDKDVEEFVKVLVNKSLIDITPGGLTPSIKFYDLLNEFSKRAFEKLVKKSITAAGGLAQSLERQDLEGAQLPDPADFNIESELVEIIKAMSQKEADNIGQGNTRISDAQAKTTLPGTSTSLPAAPKQPTDPAPAPDAAGYTQEGVDNKDPKKKKLPDSGHPEDAENVDDNQDSIHKGVSLFKSLPEARAFEIENKNYITRELNFNEKKEHGTRWRYIAEKLPEVDTSNVGAFGSRRRR